MTMAMADCYPSLKIQTCCPGQADCPFIKHILLPSQDDSMLPGPVQEAGCLFINGFPSGPKPYEEVLTFLRKVRPGCRGGWWPVGHLLPQGW